MTGFANSNGLRRRSLLVMPLVLFCMAAGAAAQNPPGNVSQFQLNAAVGDWEQSPDHAFIPDTPLLPGGGLVATWMATQGQIRARVFHHDLTPVGTEFVVNATQIPHPDFHLSDPAVAVDPTTGRFLVVWTANLPTTGTFQDVHGRLFEANGTPAPNMDSDIVIAATGNQVRDYLPDVTARQTGGFFVVWDTSTGVYPNGEDIFGTRVSADGVATGNRVLRLNYNTPNTQQSPSVAEFGDGSLIITWMSSQFPATPPGQPSHDNDGAILGRILRPDGTFQPQHDDLRINTFITGNQNIPQVAGAPGEGYIVAWQSNSAPYGPDWNIRARHSDGGEFQVDTYTTSTQSSPVAAMAADGSFIIAWVSDDPTGGTDTSSLSVHARKFFADGSPEDDQFQVNTFTPQQQSRPSVAIRADTNDFLVSWRNDVTLGPDAGSPSVQAGPCLLHGPALQGSLLCPEAKPPMDEPGRCEVWQGVGSGSASRAGRGGGATPSNAAPGPGLRYLAGGVGDPSWALPAGWTGALGRYWSHGYAQRIVSDSAPTHDHVWMVTGAGTFREFAGLEAGLYAWSSPSDETRELAWTGAGWELTDIDGTVDSFDANGYWTQRSGRNSAEVWTATYTGAQLTKVNLPDGRSESYAYWPSGKLQSITEGGVDVDGNGNGNPDDTRTWTYDWTGDDLIRITRPDGTLWELFYEDPSHPGYMTRMDLVGTDASRRVESAWEYDSSGNVIKIWRGSLLPDSSAVEMWESSVRLSGV